MGLPVMNIIFTAAARNSIRRSERGVVGMIVKDAKVPAANPVVVYKEKDIPEDLSDANKEQIKLALIGNDTAPAKIVVYVLDSKAESYETALNYFSVKKVTWLCCPTAKTDAQTETIVTWVKNERDERDKVKAVLPETAADDEGIINYATKTVTAGGKEYTAESFCSRIAGLLAGTSNKSSSTYAVLDEVTECEKKKKAELDTAIEEGKFVLYYDGEKVKVGRGVNSLQTVKKGKGNPWKKIRVVEIMDMLHDDLVLLAEDNYIGKYPNTYANKCLLVSAINSYLAEMEKGTDNWKGGIVQISEKGGEIVDLPSGSRVYPHDESIRMAKQEAKKNLSVTVAKLADSIIVREESDIDKIAEAIVRKIEQTSGNMMQMA